MLSESRKTYAERLMQLLWIINIQFVKDNIYIHSRTLFLFRSGITWRRNITSFTPYFHKSLHDLWPINTTRKSRTIYYCKYLERYYFVYFFNNNKQNILLSSVSCQEIILNLTNMNLAYVELLLFSVTKYKSVWPQSRCGSKYLARLQ